MNISVVIPMYNSADTIVAVIGSVISQTYQEALEVIVVNDGSTDGCEKVVEQLIERNQSNRTIRLINKANGGVSSARNMGIREAAGDWIALLDSDDIWSLEKLEKQVAEIAINSDILFIGTNRNNEVYPYFGKKAQRLYTVSAKEMLIKWWPSTPTVMFHRDVFEQAGGYDEQLMGLEDGDFWLRCASKYKIYVLNEFLVETGFGKRSFGESGLSANVLKMYQGEISALKGALKRKQVNILEYLGLHAWLTLKYIRRVIIVKKRVLFETF